MSEKDKNNSSFNTHHSIPFIKEAEFEEALVCELKNKGWEDEVLTYPSEVDLLNSEGKTLEFKRDLSSLKLVLK